MFSSQVGEKGLLTTPYRETPAQPQRKGFKGRSSLAPRKLEEFYSSISDGGFQPSRSCHLIVYAGAWQVYVSSHRKNDSLIKRRLWRKRSWQPGNEASRKQRCRCQNDGEKAHDSRYKILGFKIQVNARGIESRRNKGPGLRYIACHMPFHAS